MIGIGPLGGVFLHVSRFTVQTAEDTNHTNTKSQMCPDIRFMFEKQSFLLQVLVKYTLQTEAKQHYKGH